MYVVENGIVYKKSTLSNAEICEALCDYETIIDGVSYVFDITLGEYVQSGGE